MVLKHLCKGLGLLLVCLFSSEEALAEKEKSSPRLPEFAATKQLAAPLNRSTPKLPLVLSESSTLGVSPARLAAALAKAGEPGALSLRGAKEQQIFANFSRSVVLVLTKDGMGSGSLLAADGWILTSWHVVGAAREVAIIFKPAQEGAAPDTRNAVRGVVTRVDEVADLALIKIRAVPPGTKPIELAKNASLAVGADVHAIGHPIGETWSYTKGLVSQVRNGYKWKSESGLAHKADVVQTQTPISPGNSGGPLLNDDGAIVGVNTFKEAEGDGLNFAVAASEVSRFLATKTSRFAPRPAATGNQATASTPKGACDAKTLKTGISKAGDADLSLIDFDCDGKGDALVVMPREKSEPATVLVDADHNGVPERTLWDKDQDGEFDYITYDTDQDGTDDLIGSVLDENLKPGVIRSIG